MGKADMVHCSTDRLLVGKLPLLFFCVSSAGISENKGAGGRLNSLQAEWAVGRPCEHLERVPHLSGLVFERWTGGPDINPEINSGAPSRRFYVWGF